MAVSLQSSRPVCDSCMNDVPICFRFLAVLHDVVTVEDLAANMEAPDEAEDCANWPGGNGEFKEPTHQEQLPARAGKNSNNAEYCLVIMNR